MRYSSPLKLLVFCIIFSCLSIPYTSHAQQEINQPLASIRSGVEIYKVEWHPSGTVLAAATSDGLILYDENLQTVTQIYPGSNIYSLAWSPSGNEIALTNANYLEIWNWNGVSFQILATLQGSETQIKVAWRPNGTQIATIEGGVFLETWQGRLQIWDVISQQKEHNINVTFYFERNFPKSNRLNWIPSDLPLLAIVGGTLEEINGSVVVDSVATIFVINTDTGYVINEIPLVANYVASAVVWHPSGTKIIVGDPVGFGVYAAATNEYEGATSFHDYVKVLAWSPNRRYLAANDNIYDYSTSTYLGFFTRTSEIQAVDWHPDGSKLATVSGFGNIKIEDATLLSGFQVDPIANAGIDQILPDSDSNGSEAITFDGSGSSDPDGTIVSYVWLPCILMASSWR